MILSSRHRQILDLLIRQREEITAGEIAAEIKVSTRTVHRELAELESMLAGHGLTLHKRSGKGIQLQADPDKLAAFQSLLQGENAVEHSAQERKILILCTLLAEEEPVKLFSLAHSLAVTIPTVTHDLDELEAWVKRAGLVLVRRRGYGVEISGSEYNKRRLIGTLSSSYLDDTDLFGKAPESASPAVHMLLQLVGKPHFSEVESALWHVEDKGLSALSESEYTDLLIEVSICIARIQQGKLIEQEELPLSRDEPGRPWERAGEALVKRLPVAFTSAEAAYLGHLLERRAAHGRGELLTAIEPRTMDIVNKLIKYMEASSGMSLGEDRSLRDGLLAHLGSALRRLNAGLNIRNPLLGQIKRDYESLFLMIRQAVDAAILEIEVPDEEIGFLVMHFGASMERLKQFGRDVSAIIVCTSGIGTSKMLAVRLTKEFPQIEIIGNASWFEAARIPETDYDLIISTVDLPISEERYIKLSPLLAREDAERLRSFIHNVTLRKDAANKKSANSDSRAPDSSSRLHRIQNYVNEIVRIVDQFELHGLDQSFDSLEATLRAICEYPRRSGTIEQTETIVRLLLEREKLSSQVIPDTGVALFHIRSPHVSRPSFSLFRLREPLRLAETQAEEPEVKQLLLMLGPQELSKESLEVLSEISSFLLMPEMLLLLKEGGEQEIKQFLSQELAAFLENKK